MSAKEHEEYVRSRWLEVDVDEDIDGSCVLTAGFDVDEFQRGLSTTAVNKTEAWSAAYAFTLEREEQIRQVEEEVRALKEVGEATDFAFFSRGFRSAWSRILAREQAALAELKKGMRQ